MRKYLLLSAAMLAALSAPASADSQSIETVVVTAGLEGEIPQLLSNNGVVVDTIGATAIKNGGYVDISQTLSGEAPGLYITSQHGPFDYVDVSMLGSRTEDVLWLVDGVRINNRLYAGTTPLDTLPASMVDRIEVIQGGETLFYGTQAIAGVVNIITKEFTATPDGALTIGGNSDMGAHLDGYFRDGIGRSQFVVYASADMSPGFDAYPAADFQPSETLRKRGYHMYTGGAKYQYTATKDLKVTASLEKNMGHLDYPQPQDVNSAYNQRDETLLTTKLDYTPGDDLQFFVKGYYHWWLSHYTEFDNDPSAPGGIDVIEDHGHWGYVDRGVNAMAKIALFPGVSSVLGYDYQNYNGSDAVLVISPHSGQDNAVFGQLEATDLIPRAHLALGFRYNVPNDGPAAFVWNASGQYDITDSLYAKAMVGTNFRLPTAEELYANDPQDELGDPNLRPERSFNTNGSLGGLFNIGSTAIDWRVTGFYREIKDLIDYASFDVATDQYVFGNVPGEVTTRGFETYLSAAVADSLSASADFTYADATESGSTQQFDQIPRTLLKLGLDYHPTTMPFGLNATVQHVGDLYDSAGNSDHVAYGNYTILNLGGRVFLDDAHEHRIGVNLDNVFNTAYASHLETGVQDGTGNPYVVHDLGLPRTLYVNYTWSFQ